MQIIPIFAIAASLTTLLPGPANAQDGPKGVAFVEAPEQSSGMCFGDNPDEAFDCARKICTSNGTAQSDCLRVKWCYPSGWSADIFLQHKEGLHWHEYLCGWQTREDLETAIKIMCEGSLGEDLIECAVVGMWSSARAPIELIE